MMTVLPETAFEVVELRRYATCPGRRDALIELFERELIEPQEACGMVPFGHYRDLDDPDQFVWLRGFPRMESRRKSLEAFYTSPTWRDHRAAANATMVGSDNVLLLRPARRHSGFDLAGLVRPERGGTATGAASLVAVSVLMLREPADDTLIAAFENAVLPQLRGAAQRVAYLVTEKRPNDFPQLPVREGEHAFVVAGICRTAEAFGTWRRIVGSEQLPGRLREAAAAGEMLRLAPASRALYA